MQSILVNAPDQNITTPFPISNSHDIPPIRRLSVPPWRGRDITGHGTPDNVLLPEQALGQLPIPQVILGIIQNLPRLRRALVRRPHIPRHHRRIVQHLQQPQPVPRQDHLLLGPLNRRQKFGRIRLLELLPRLSSPLAPPLNHSPPKKVKEREKKLTTFPTCASPTNPSASALTNSCSNTTSRALPGSFILTRAISSATLSRPARTGATLLSVSLTVLSVPRASSSARAYTSSCSPSSDRITPTLSLTSLSAGSMVEPHSESCVAMERRSRAAVVWAWMSRLVDFMRRWRRCEGDGGREVRREEREKRWCEGGAVGVEEVDVPVEERLEERMERARFLRGGRLVWGGGAGGGVVVVPLGKGEAGVGFEAFARRRHGGG